MQYLALIICQLTSLQILDLSHNSTIPQCFNNFTVMAQKQHLDTKPFDYYYSYFASHYIEHVSVNTKGMHLEYSKILCNALKISLS